MDAGCDGAIGGWVSESTPRLFRRRPRQGVRRRHTRMDVRSGRARAVRISRATDAVGRRGRRLRQRRRGFVSLALSHAWRRRARGEGVVGERLQGGERIGRATAVPDDDETVDRVHEVAKKSRRFNRRGTRGDGGQGFMAQDDEEARGGASRSRGGDAHDESVAWGAGGAETSHRGVHATRKGEARARHRREGRDIPGGRGRGVDAPNTSTSAEALDHRDGGGGVRCLQTGRMRRRGRARRALVSARECLGIDQHAAR